MSNQRRLAITIEGGASLGAYEAGVLDETLDLIEHNNAQGGATPWFIDVITGASAGSMTAAITAVSLLAGKTHPPDPFSSAWVAGVSVIKLAPADQADFPNNLFDANNLDTIAAANVNLPRQTAQPHAAFNRDKPLRLAFTLSQLQAEPNKVPTWAGLLAYKEFADLARFDFALNGGNISVKSYGTAAEAPPQPDRVITDFDAARRAFIQAAIASGSFPIAFEPRRLWRWTKDRWQETFFMDGGLYNNDPVGQAINLAHEADWETDDPNIRDGDRRFLIVHIAPSDIAPPIAFPVIGDLQNIPVLTALGKIAGGFITESQTSGLRGIGPVNAQIRERLEDLAKILEKIKAEHLTTPPTDALTVLAGLRGIDPARLELLRNWLVADLDIAQDGTLLPDLSGNARQLEKNVINLDPARREIFTDLALLYDLSTDLVDKVPLRPILIAPQGGLAGGPLFGFDGFLGQELRRHDYQQGRFDAYQAWKQVSTEDSFKLDPNQQAPPNPPATLIDPIELKKFKERVHVVTDSLTSDLIKSQGLLSRIEKDAIQRILQIIDDWALDKALKPATTPGD